MEMAILHKTHLCKEIIEVGSEEGSRWGAGYQERSDRNGAMLKRAKSQEVIVFLTLPAVEIVSVVVVVVLVATEEKKRELCFIHNSVILSSRYTTASALTTEPFL